MFKSKTGFLLGAAMIGGGIALTLLSPATIPFMVVAGGAFSLFELGKGAINFATAAAKGDGDGMENAFKDLGTGIIGGILTLVGIKGTAGIAAEAKATGAALRAGASEVEAVKEGLRAAETAKSMSLTQAFKTELSLFSKDGVVAIRYSRRLAALKKNLTKSAREAQSVAKTKTQPHPEAQQRPVNLNKPLYEDELAEVSRHCTLAREIQGLSQQQQIEIAQLFRQIKLESIDAFKERVSSVYANELSKLLKRLGIVESKIAKNDLPELIFNPNLSGDARFCMSHQHNLEFIVEVNPYRMRLRPISDKISSLRSKPEPATHFGPPNDAVQYLIAHEVRHIEQDLFPLMHLSFMRYIRAHHAAIYPTIQKQPTFLKRLMTSLVYKFTTTFKYLSKAARSVREFKVPTSNLERQRALRMVQEGIECDLANADRFARLMGRTLNCTGEVDARMYSMVSRLETLRDTTRLTNSERNLMNLRERLSLIEKELAFESEGFITPRTEELQAQLTNIRNLIDTIKSTVL